MSKHRNAPRRRPSTLARLPLTAAIYFALGSAAWAQADSPPADQKAATDSAAKATTADNQARVLDVVTVTAQKRTENLQKVPISIQVLGEQKLQEQDVADFDDYASLLPSLSYQSKGGGTFNGPGFEQVYMRGVASGGDGNHSGPLPSVGTYLDEQPITTVQGALDVQIYDVQRIEALAGPQGTLYGASSQAGTLRIITNKPDPSGFSSSYTVEANTIANGGSGYVAEGFVNQPITDSAAFRVVAWSKHDAGYIDNVFGTRTFLTSGITINNRGRVQDNYNDSYTEGARAALKIDLNDNWTITPTVMAQHERAYGSAGYDPSVGTLELTHFFPENAHDRWTQLALTVQGKIGNFDLVYAFGHLNRDDDYQADYSDYGYWYDQYPYYYGAYFYDNNGDFIDPSQQIHGRDGYTKTSHELRISSPKENRLRFVAGYFQQDQGHDIFQRYIVKDMFDGFEVPGFADTIWLTAQHRQDNDQALFGEVSFDITDKLTATAGARAFRADNSLKGFFGFGAGFSGSTGESQCFSPKHFHGAPCTNLNKDTKEDGTLGKFNLTYQIDPSKMVYFTWSEGYRPGGINRKGTLPPYKADYLTNWEFGWKTTWLDNQLSFNGAVFQENWNDFQFAFLGQNSLTQISNSSQARIRGFEGELTWAATYNLRLTAGLALYDAKLTANYCGWLKPNGDPETHCPAGTIDPNGNVVSGPQAPSGTRLPLTARYKGNLAARYTWNIGDYEAFWQASMVFQGDRTADVRTYESNLMGEMGSYTLTDLSAGFKKDNWSFDFFVKNAFDQKPELAKYAACTTAVCGFETYTITAQPRTFGIRFTQSF